MANILMTLLILLQLNLQIIYMKQYKNTPQSIQLTKSNKGEQHLFNLTDTIFQESYERYLQISLSNSVYANQYYIQKLNEGKKAVDEQYLQKNKRVEIQQKLSHSNKINQCQMKKAKARFNMCQEVFKTVLQKVNIQLQENQQQYSLTLIKFIVQGALRMFQPELMIKCLPRDVPLIQKLLTDAQQTFNSIMEEQTGRTYPIKLKVNKKDVLNLRNLSDSSSEFNKKKQQEQCIGGVILTDLTGNITYKNTIDTRVNILKEICLPLIRVMLWPNLDSNSSNGKSI